MRGETVAETAKRMEGQPNTSANGQACALAGAHRCGGAVTLGREMFLCAAGSLAFMDWEHRGGAARLARWVESVRAQRADVPPLHSDTVPPVR